MLKNWSIHQSWMKVNTVNYRVGIGITQNLTVPFQVVGSANITSVNATGELHRPDGLTFINWII